MMNKSKLFTSQSCPFEARNALEETPEDPDAAGPRCKSTTVRLACNTPHPSAATHKQHFRNRNRAGAAKVLRNPFMSQKGSSLKPLTLEVNGPEEMAERKELTQNGKQRKAFAKTG